VDITNAVISRFNLDGTLKVVSRREDADAVLNIDLINFDQEGTRFTQLESVEEYRLFVTTNVQLKDNRTDQVLLDERNVTGKTSYFVQTSRSDTMYKARKRESISEPLRNAAVRAIEDYAHNVVDLVTEAW
jgi:hypothetical protein